MTPQETLFLNIIRDHINGVPTAAVAPAQWEDLLSWTVQHQLIGIVYQQVRPWAPSDVITRLKRLTIQSIATGEQRKHVCLRIERQLQEKHIPYFIVKGPIAASYYPKPEYRMMGDVDLVLRMEDLDRADRVLRQVGAKNLTKSANGEWSYELLGLHLEIHVTLIDSPEDPSRACYDFFAGCWDYVRENRLDINVHFIYILLHLRIHFILSGVGFRQFLDLAMMLKCGALDLEWIHSKINEFDLEQFAGICFSLIQQWWDIESPWAVCTDQDLLAEATQYIFSNGVFGFDNEENQKGFAVASANRSHHPHLAMLRDAVFTLFPPYRTMISSEKYAYVK